MRLLGHRVSVLTRTQLCAQLTGQAGGIKGLLQEGTNTSCYHCLPSFLPPSLTSYLPSPQAIELDPQNENYKSNLETVEQQLKAKVVSWCVSQVVMMCLFAVDVGGRGFRSRWSHTTGSTAPTRRSWTWYERRLPPSSLIISLIL